MNKPQSIGDDPEFRKLLADLVRRASYNISGKASPAALIAYIDGRTAGPVQSAAPDPTEAAIEQRAKEIYAGFVFADRYPWVEGGNSIRQDDARELARKELAAPSTQQEESK